MADWESAVAAAAAAAPQNKAEERPTVVSGRTLLIDGDYLAYYAAGNDETDPGRARQNALEKIEAFRVLSGSERVVMHLTASESNKGWRFVAATVKPYQGGRDGGRKPKNWRSLRDWLETYDGSAFKTKTWTDREADDGMAYHAAVLGSDLAVVATADKDMRMFAGIHIDWKTYDITVVERGEYRKIGANGKTYGPAWFWQQMLQGDTADDIPGLPKYVKPNGKLGPLGEKTAEKLLAITEDNVCAYWIVSDLYEGFYGSEWEDRFFEQAVLLWMRTDKKAMCGNFLQVVPSENQGDFGASGCALGARIRRHIEEVDCVEETYRNAT